MFQGGASSHRTHHVVQIRKSLHYLFYFNEQTLKQTLTCRADTKNKTRVSKSQNNMDTLLKGSHRSFRLFYLTFFSEYFLSC